MARKARRSCRPCKAARSCRKRRGAPRFATVCKTKFRSCMHDTLKASGSVRVAGKKCMPELHRCNKRQGPAIRRYKRMRAS
jgi:hypothetical protein